MYKIKDLEELEVGDKALIVIPGMSGKLAPMIVTVEEIDLNNGSFLCEEMEFDIHLDRIAVMLEPE